MRAVMDLYCDCNENLDKEWHTVELREVGTDYVVLDVWCETCGTHTIRKYKDFSVMTGDKSLSSEKLPDEPLIKTKDVEDALIAKTKEMCTSVRLVDGVYRCENCGWESKAGEGYTPCPDCDPENYQSYIDMVMG